MPAHFNISQHHLHPGWPSVEERLPAEADSLGDLLVPLTRHVPPTLLGEAGWQPVLASARQWPATCAALPFGFEFQLLDPRPQADFGIMLTNAGRTADWIRRQGSDQEGASGGLSFSVRLARLFDALAVEESALGREIDRVMIEIDIASAALLTGRDPGLFLYFNRASDGTLRDSDAVLTALNAAAGWADDPAEFRLARQFGSAIPSGVAYISLGAFPGRGRGFRLTATGFVDGAGVEAFLRRVGWKGRYDVLAGTIARLGSRDAFGKLGLMLYACGGELETRLGLYLRQSQFALPSLLDGLADEGCVAEKLAALHPAAMRPVVLWGKAGGYTLVRAFSHAKLVLTESGIREIKAYTGLVCV